MIETLILLIFLNITLKALKYDHTEKYLLCKCLLPILIKTDIKTFSCFAKTEIELSKQLHRKASIES